MDQIRIKGLELFARHGVNTAENVLGQKFRVNAAVFMDIHEAADDDNIAKTVNYGALCRFITDYMQQHMYKLIETAAEKLAEAILLDFDRNGRIVRVELEIEKPWAPIGLPLESVSVQISRGWETVYLSAGSNMGDREAYLDGAVSSLKEIRGVNVEAVSEWIETVPYGPVEQDAFLNGVVKLRTLLPPHRLLEVLHAIENEAGRERTVHWGPRTLDLDILFYGREVVNDPDLVIPHPDLENRYFVLEPFVRLDPYFRHPTSGKTMRVLRDALDHPESSQGQM